MKLLSPEDHEELSQLLNAGFSAEDLAAAQAAANAKPAAPPAAKPPPDLSQPLGYRPSAPAPRDVELEGLQAKAKEGRSDARLGQTVADFASRPSNLLDYAQRLGGGGVSPGMKSPNLLAGRAEEGEQAINDLQARRKSEAGMAGGAEMSDPNSQTAQMYRQVITGMHPGMAQQLAGASAKQLTTAYPWLEKFAAENNDLLQAQTTAAAKAKEKGDATALAAKNRAEDQKTATDRFNATDARSRESSAANRELARAGLGIRQGEADRKATETADEQTVPGYTHDAKVKQSPGEVGKVRAMTAASKTISDNIDKLDKLIEQNGTETLPTAAKAEMEALGANILAELKGPAGFELGVLAGPDMAIMEKAVGDATSFSLGNVLGMSEQTRAKLRASKDSMTRKLADRMSSGGYSPDAKGGAATRVKTMKLPSGEVVEVE